MSRSKDTLRVFIAVTEASSIPDLWQAALRTAGDSPAEFVALYLHDERWHRAASLPFTREISRLSGAGQDFTRQRAAALHGDLAGRTREQLNRLASETKLQITFEILSAHESPELRQHICIERDILIAPIALEGWPIFAELARVNRKVLLVDVEDHEHGNEHTDTTT